MIENTIVNDAGDGSNDTSEEVDKTQYAKAFVPKGYGRVAIVKENSDPTGDGYTVSNN